MSRLKKKFIVVTALLLSAGSISIGVLAIGAPIDVKDASMEPNIGVGTRVFLNRFAFFNSLPQRGDLIVLRSENPASPLIVRRVIGLPTDTVHLEKDTLFINGEKIQREEMRKNDPEMRYSVSIIKSCSQAITVRETIDAKNFDHLEMFVDKSMIGPIDATTRIFEVPEDRVFVLGDNRDIAIDSRQLPQIDGLGFVSTQKVIGKVILGLSIRTF